MRNGLAWVSFMGLLAMGPAMAGDERGTVQLETFVSNTKSLRAQFVQSLVSPQGEILEQSKGKMMLQRPGKFRWDYTSPEQQVIADGKNLWVYDVDLAQVTVNSLASSLGKGPATLLSGSIDELERLFSIRDGGGAGGLQWVVLEPTGGENDYKDIRLAFKQGAVQKMELTDNFDQITRIEFAKLESNPSLAANSFQFSPPEGVDVIKGATPAVGPK
jgi:outer membrane lipoprotein carrier protein